MTVTWSGDKELFDTLNYIETRIDKKISYGLNGLAYGATQEIKSELPKWLNLGRGANWVKGSFQYDKSSPDNLSVTVGALDRLFLAALMEDGGQRLPQKKAIPIPVKKIAKNIALAYQKPGVFSANIGNVAGLWQRVKKRKMSTLSLIYAFEDRTQYKGNNIEFYDTIQNYFDRNFEGMVSKSISELMDRFASK